MSVAFAYLLIAVLAVSLHRAWRRIEDLKFELDAVRKAERATARIAERADAAARAVLTEVEGA